MLPSRFLAQVAVAFVLVSRANAESHTISFVNSCGFGSPELVFDGNNILPNGSNSYTSIAPWSGIAFLQTGSCLANGEGCTLLETTLINPQCNGCGSSTDISLIAPHQYNVETSFAYYSGCDGAGQMCTNSACTDAAFFNPNDNQVQVACQVNNVNLLFAFCANASQLVLEGAINAAGGSSLPDSPSTIPSSVPTTLGGSAPTSPLPTTPSTPSSVPTTLSGSLNPPSSFPAPSGIPSSASFVPGSVIPGTSPTPTPSTNPTDTSTDTGCEETGSTTPSSTPTPPTVPTNTDVTDPGCEETGSTTPSSTPIVSNPGNVLTEQTPSPTSVPPTSAPTTEQTTPPTSTPPPTSSRNCRPRTTSPSLFPSNSAPTSPAITPSDTPTPVSVPARHRHRRTANRMNL